MTAHHPAANGLVERFHWTLKAAIMCHGDQQSRNLHGIQRGPASVSSWACVWQAPKNPRRDTNSDCRPSGSSMPYRRAPPSHSPPQTSSSSTPHLLATFVHSDLEKCTHIFIRTQYARLWRTPTAAPIRSCHGERRHWNFLCTGGPSRCQPTESSQPTSSVGLTTGTTASTHQSTQPWQ
jgi:hypothetical protein